MRRNTRDLAAIADDFDGGQELFAGERQEDSHRPN